MFQGLFFMSCNDIISCIKFLCYHKYQHANTQEHKTIILVQFFLDLRFFYPIAAIYFSQIADSYALGMSIYSITMLTSALCELPTGIFSDFIGRKNTIVAGAVMNLLAVIFYAIGGQYLILVIGAIF